MRALKSAFVCIGTTIRACLAIAVCGVLLGGCGSETASQNAAIAIAPDGRHIVFTSGDMGGAALFVLSLDTMHVTRLTDGKFTDSDPCYDPSGSYVVFDRTNAPATPRRLCRVDLRTRTVTQITDGSAGNDECPSVTGDGRAIVFCRFGRQQGLRGWDPWNDSDVYMLQVATGRVDRLTFANYMGCLNPQCQSVRSPVYYAADHETADGGDTPMLSSVPPGGGAVTTLTSDGRTVVGGSPSLSPDGRHIAFTADPVNVGDYHVYLLTLGRAPRVREVFAGTPDDTPMAPVVSPDGRSIYFLRGYKTSIWVVGVDGSGAHEIADGEIFQHPMSWRPTR
jgi:Tol biopolymer transport system component